MPYRLIKTMDGRRGGFLLLAGLSYIAIGISNVMMKPSASLDLAFAWLPHQFNSKSLGWIWILSGLFILIASLVSAKYSKLEATGYVMSLLPPFIWALIFGISHLFGNPYGIRSGVVYLSISILMYYVAGWPDSVTLRKESADAPTA